MTDATREPEVVLSTSVAVAAGLLGGFLLGRLTHRPAVTATVFGGVGLLVGTQWLENRGPATAAILGTLYVGATQLSNPFGHQVFRVPALVLATGLTAVAAYALHDKYLTVGLDPAEQPTDRPE